MTEKIKKTMPENEKKKHTPKYIPIESLIELVNDNPGLTTEQIGKLLGCSGGAVRQRLGKVRERLNHYTNYKKNKSKIYGLISQNISQSLTSGKVKPPKTGREYNEYASALEKIDRIERLEAGKSTNIIDMSPEMKELTDKLFQEMAGKK